MNLNKSSKILISFFFVVFLLSTFYFLLSNKVSAAEFNFEPNYPWGKTKSTSGLVGNFYNIALAVVGVTALGMMVYGGVLWTVSGDNPSQKTKALDAIKGAIAGLVLLLGGYLLLKTINPGLVELKEPTETMEAVKTIER